MADHVRVVTAAGAVVCGRCRRATTFWARFRGLMWRSSLDPDEGLLLERTSAIHTHFMRFPIDVLFLDDAWHVVAIERALRPWRLARSSRARHVVELAAGVSDVVGLRVGDRLEPIRVER